MSEAAKNQDQNPNPKVEQPAKVRMVKMQALYPCRIVRKAPWGDKIIDQEIIVKPGDKFEATEEEAKDFEQVLTQHHSFVGQRHHRDGEVTRHRIQRAKRI